MSLRRSAFAVAGSAAVLALAVGCASDGAPAPTATGGTTAVPAPGTAAPGAAQSGAVIPGDSGGVTTTQAEQLCSDMAAQLQNWRTYTPTIGKGGLNTVVGTWAARNGVNMLDLVAHKARIDVITSAQCPDVRDGALYALEIPDLASGLIGF
ncbi:hypothetical protein ACFYVR_17645 [Rhodococcus sp. NPDC003318]|uniref:hypothetical protein n=1 Tax=Rhodococcus sp. NPDC003318 TaxID=3364503 RepID=UPI00368F33F4